MLDPLRSAYAAMPPSVRRRVAPLAALVPVRYRYGNTFWETRRNIERSRSDVAWLEQERLRRLRETIAAAVKTPYYQKQFQSIFGGMPDIDTFTFEDLQRIPILSKEVLREDPESLLAVPKEQADVGSTSGSSGRPVKFWLSKDRGAKEFAYITSFWSRIGFVPGKSRRAVLRGVSIDRADAQPYQWDPALLELRLSPFQFTPENMHRYCELFEEYNIEFLHGYPSAINVFANYVVHSGWQPPACFKGILPASEATLPQHRALFERAFAHAQIMKYYGMSEKVLIAGQLKDAPDDYDFEPLYGYGEMVNEAGEACAVGETGRIIGTGFITHAMPLLRYDTEDFATLREPAARENGYRLGVSNIVGRWDQEYLVGANNELVPMSAVNAHTEAYAKIHFFQLYQERAGEVTVHVVPQKGVGEADLAPFIDELHGRIGEAVRFTLKLVDEIPFKTENGKRPFIDQRLDLSRYMGDA
jgi:phenylacetate-CoA ligase